MQQNWGLWSPLGSGLLGSCQLCPSLGHTSLTESETVMGKNKRNGFFDKGNTPFPNVQYF